ncbi:MAG: Fic family protein [Chlorobi bacterium]|nr:Fic family protein [Chlorobiota bacterium]MBX7216176.1 Fic family protein [Candidatus Kapabacteria bacterium]
MRFPAIPPNTEELFRTLGKAENSGERLMQIAMAQFGPAPNHQYRHWDTLRHLQPPEGFTLEEWWLGIRLARQSLSRTLPITDSHGNPFFFTMTDPGLHYLRLIDSQASGTIADWPALENERERERHIKRSLIEEAIQSSRFEGAVTTRKVAKEMIITQRKPRSRSEQMILNNYNAMQFIGEVKKARLTPDIILELQRILTHGTLDDPSAAGRFRRPDERVVMVDIQDNEELHIPPDAAEMESRIQQLCDVANQPDDLASGAPYIHPVVRSILLHFWLAYNHPFVDGNGRTARALFYWSMAHRGYWLCEYLTISSILTKAPAKYFRSFLYTETDNNDATYFVLAQLGVIEQALNVLRKQLEQKSRAQKKVTAALQQVNEASRLLNPRQIALLTHAMTHANSAYTIHTHMKAHSVTYLTARTDLLKLVESGLLEQRKTGKTLYFSLSPNAKQQLSQLQKKG